MTTVARLSTALLAFFLASANQSNAADAKTGHFVTTATAGEIIGAEWDGHLVGAVAPEDEIEWTVFVPEKYSPEQPAGVVVYLSPSNSGQMPRRWAAVFAEKNLIWIAANNSGNRSDTRKRIANALLASIFLRNDYAIDPNRVYVAGLSGGGRVASIVAPEYPQWFRGAIYICGVNNMQGESPEKAAAAQLNRYVFLTGSNDFNRDETKDIYTRYLRSGFDDSLYLEIKFMGHENPNAKGIRRALDFLDNE